MANEVYANGMELACKAGSGKVIAAFPDVCMTPPENPATPPGVPVPYPDTAQASDTTDGSKNVKISGKEIMLKNKSCFKTLSGNEAGSTAKKGVVSSKIKGKVYFVKWSMDVKVEGENVDRHLDLTTNNHGSPTANEAAPWPYADTVAISNISECKEDADKAKEKCKGKKGPPDCTKECKKAQKCILIAKKDDKKACCKEDTTGHHLIEVHCFSPTGERGGALEDLESYNQNKAPCVCASQSRADGTHGVLHAVQSQLEGAFNDRNTILCEWENSGKTGKGVNQSKWNYAEARSAGVTAHKIAFPHCNPACVEKQLDSYHKDECGFDDDTPLRSDPGAATRSSGNLTRTQQSALNDAVEAVKGITQGVPGV